MKKYLGVFLLSAAAVFGGERTLKIELELTCSESEELNALVEMIEERGEQNLAYDEWKGQMREAIDKLWALIEARQVRVCHAHTSVE